MIHEHRTAGIKGKDSDLLSGLTDATEESVGGYEKLTDMEVMSEYWDSIKCEDWH